MRGRCPSVAATPASPWITKTPRTTYRTRWLKYRFDGTGAYIGKTVVTEEITVIGRHR